MSILVNKNTKVIVQGLTGRAGRFHAQQCVSYGTQIVGGVTPGKGNTSVDEIPVFDTVENAIVAGSAANQRRADKRKREAEADQEA